MNSNILLHRICFKLSSVILFAKLIKLRCRNIVRDRVKIWTLRHVTSLEILQRPQYWQYLYIKTVNKTSKLCINNHVMAF